MFLLKSCGRDKVIILWDLQSRKQIQTVALYDSLEAMIILPRVFYFNGINVVTGGVSVATGGENGKTTLL